jgi:hypothetical protein
MILPDFLLIHSTPKGIDGSFPQRPLVLKIGWKLYWYVIELPTNSQARILKAGTMPFNTPMAC